MNGCAPTRRGGVPTVAQSVERIDRFDAGLMRLLAWSAFAIAALTVIALAFV